MSALRSSAITPLSAPKFSDARKGTIVLDVTDEEAEQMGASLRSESDRGRPVYAGGMWMVKANLPSGLLVRTR